MSVHVTSSVKRQTPPILGRSDADVPLNPGDLLSGSEFERRCLAHPEIKKAELIEGVVIMPSPAHFKNHGLPLGDIMGWMSVYGAHTPGGFVGDNTTVRLDFEN